MYIEYFNTFCRCHTKTYCSTYWAGSKEKMRAMMLSNKYSIPRSAIEIFQSICVICNTKKGVNRKLVITITYITK